MRIKGLQMRAKVVVEGFFSGLHRSPFHGFSVEFSEYREYSPGDNMGHIHWPATAHRGKLMVKVSEEP